ncbi:hypothetical protein Fot_29168 [Forsythia ovata]|uniref:PH domain-containing protein n=1 Tax=Forsythia ovata TaxID=205694 RepID=A0ABD1TR57_9LAMI
MVNLELAPDEVDRLEEWVEYIRKLFGGREDLEFDPSYWACSKYPTKLTMDEEELEVLEDESLIRRAKKPRTSSSKSLQNQPTGGALSLETHEVFEPQASERLNYDQSVHIKKVLEEMPSDINSEVFDMILHHLQWTITIVNSFWTDGWASYFAKSSAKAKLIVAKALAARSLGSD